MSRDRITVAGTVEFIWHGGSEEHTLLNLDPERPGTPHTFEIPAGLVAGVDEEISEGDRIEITYEIDEHEVVDPDSGTTSDRQRARVLKVKLL